jgi:hypothetical protein
MHHASFLPAEAIARIFGAANGEPDALVDVAPTQGTLVVRRHPGTRNVASIC